MVLQMYNLYFEETSILLIFSESIVMTHILPPWCHPQGKGKSKGIVIVKVKV